MRLYLTAKTAMKDLVIDYIEVNLKDGKTISLTWDESEFGIEDGLFTARYKGVYFDEVYGNGLINELRDMQIAGIGVYSENNEPVTLAVVHVTVEDELERLDFIGLLYQEGDFEFTVPMGDEHEIKHSNETVDCSRLGFFDEMEESCWDLFKSYCELLGVELVPDKDDEDAISFDIAKGIQDHIIDLFLKQRAIVRNFFYFKIMVPQQRHGAGIDRRNIFGQNTYSAHCSVSSSLIDS